MKVFSYAMLKFFCMGLCFIVLPNIGWTDDHLQVMEQEKQIVLTGEISKALGEYDSYRVLLNISSVDMTVKNTKVLSSLMQQRRTFTVHWINSVLSPERRPATTWKRRNRHRRKVLQLLFLLNGRMAIKPERCARKTCYSM